MKIAVISDVHSNLVALESVLKDAKDQGVNQYWSLGDQIGYGPRPLECLNLVLQMCKMVIKGNHEDSVCNPKLCDGLNRFATEGVNFSRSKLTTEIIGGIDKFPLVKQLPKLDFVLCHGSFTGDSAWRYLDCPYKAKEELKHTPNRICLVGHTHRPFVFGDKVGLMKFLPDNLELNSLEKYVINVGSVGQPRDGDCRSCYGVFDINDDKIIFNLRKVFYDIAKVEKEIRDAGISLELAERLYSGE